MATIQEGLAKIKALGLVATDHIIAEFGLIMVIFLLSVASFGLGRLSAYEAPKPPISILEGESAPVPASLPLGGLVVASKSGSAYYYPWCAGATRLAPRNQLWFDNEDAARRAGYTPAKACKGLGN